MTSQRSNVDAGFPLFQDNLPGFDLHSQECSFIDEKVALIFKSAKCHQHLVKLFLVTSPCQCRTLVHNTQECCNEREDKEVKVGMREC